MRKKILIAGDSWGCGEWDQAGKVSHKGIEEYFIQAKYGVKNISIPGGYHTIIREKIEETLITFRPNYTFLFFTNVFRDGPGNFWESLDDIQNYIERNEKYKRQALEEYNKLGIKIHIIGGLTKVTDEDIKDFENIEIALPSFQEFFIPGYEQYTIQFQDYLYRLPYNISKELLEFVWEEQKKWSFVQAHHLMGPDAVHPNREAHKMLFEYLQSNIIK